jgi:hypothetical protein
MNTIQPASPEPTSDQWNLAARIYHDRDRDRDESRGLGQYAKLIAASEAATVAREKTKTLADVKGLHDALLHAHLAIRVLLAKLLVGESVSSAILTVLEAQYGSPETPVDALEVVVASRRQFSDAAIENAALRREAVVLRRAVVAAREERDERIADAKAPLGQMREAQAALAAHQPNTKEQI